MNRLKVVKENNYWIIKEEVSSTKAWLDKMGIEQYIINSDGTVDVNTSVDLSRKGLLNIPIQFRKIRGSFNCSQNKLTSLVGSPQEVSHRFHCGQNKLTSLQGAPVYVGEGFYCNDNPSLTSLQGAPTTVGEKFVCANTGIASLQYISKKIGGSIDCGNNDFLTSLEGCQETVDGDFSCHLCPKLTTLKGGPEKVNYDFDCRESDLISLANAPIYIGGYFDCTGNPRLSILEIKTLRKHSKIVGKLYSDIKQIKNKLYINDIIDDNIIEALRNDYSELEIKNMSNTLQSIDNFVNTKGINIQKFDKYFPITTAEEFLDYYELYVEFAKTKQWKK